MTTNTKTMPDRADLDVSALTLMYQLSTDPDLHAYRLPGETDEEQAARRTAAADIVDDGLARIAAAGPEEAAHLIRLRIKAHAVEAAALVAAWSEQIRGAVA